MTVIVDLTSVIDGTGPARLLDMVAGRSADALSSWFTERDKNFRSRVKVVSMDGFAGYRTAAAASLPAARAVMDPFHVVHLAADKLTVCRQRIQHDTLGHRVARVIRCSGSAGSCSPARTCSPTGRRRSSKPPCRQTTPTSRSR